MLATHTIKAPSVIQKPARQLHTKIQHSQRKIQPIVFGASRSPKYLSMGSLPKTPIIQGDLNNTSSLRDITHIIPDSAYSFRSLEIPQASDNPKVREKYRPFILSPHITSHDWISKLELSTVTKMAEADLQKTGERLKVLVLYGSLRQR